MAASNNKQVPAIFTQFYKTAYLAGSGKLTSTTAFAPIPNDNEPEFGSVTVATGALTISLATAGILEIAGKTIEIPAGGTLPVNKLAVGEYLLSVTYADGKKETKSIEVTQGATVAVAFSYRQASPTKPIPMREGGMRSGIQALPAVSNFMIKARSAMDGATWRQRQMIRFSIIPAKLPKLNMLEEITMIGGSRHLMS